MTRHLNFPRSTTRLALIWIRGAPRRRPLSAPPSTRPYLALRGGGGTMPGSRRRPWGGTAHSIRAALIAAGSCIPGLEFKTLERRWPRAGVARDAVRGRRRPRARARTTVGCDRRARADGCARDRRAPHPLLGRRKPRYGADSGSSGRRGRTGPQPAPFGDRGGGGVRVRSSSCGDRLAAVFLAIGSG